MKSKRWLLIFFLLFFTGTLAYMALNYAVDPLGYFKVKKGEQYYRSGDYTRAIKSEYLLKNSEQYDAVIIGGSKCGVLDTELLSEYTGKHYYNFYSNSGNFSDYLTYSEYLIKKAGISEITLHISSFEVEKYTAVPSNILQVPAIVDGNVFDKTAEFLSYLLTDVNTLKNGLNKGTNTAYSDSIADGVRNRRSNYKMMKKDPEQYVEQHVLKQTRIYLPKLFQQAANDLPAYDANLEALRQIKALCEENGVTLKVVIGASFVGEHNAYECDRYYAYLNELVTITDVWDFSDYNGVNMNPYNFVNRMHYSKDVGDLMIRTMYGEEKKEGFGVYLTTENIDDYLKARKAFYEELKKEFEATGTIALQNLEDDSYIPLTHEF